MSGSINDFTDFSYQGANSITKDTLDIKNKGNGSMWNLIAAGASMGLSLIGDLINQNQQQQQFDFAKSQLEKSKISGSEKSKLLDNTSDYFNTTSLNNANSNAFSLGNILNKDTMRGLNSSILLGQRANALSTQELNITEYNNKIDNQIASLRLPDSIDTGNMFASGVLGFKIGDSIDSLIK